MSKNSGTKFEMKGKVIESLRGSKFNVQLEDNNVIVTCTLSGKLRMNNIRIIEGDMVDVELDVSDVTKGRITWRYK